MLSGIGQNAIFTTFTSSIGGGFPATSGVFLPWNNAGGNHEAWLQDLVTHFSNDYDHNNPNVTAIPFDPDNDIVIFLSSSHVDLSIANNFTVYGESGGGFPWLLSRFMFHELAHVASQPNEDWTQHLSRGLQAGEPWESDTVALNAEDILYRSNFTGQPVVGGHSPITVPNFAGVAAFDLLTGRPTMALGALDGRDAVIFAETSGGRTTRKYVFEREIEAPGTSGADLNHYILNETVEALNVSPVSAAGLLSPLLQAVMADSATGGDGSVAAKAESASAALTFLGQVRDQELPGWKFKPGDLVDLMASLPRLDQTTARLLSAESSSQANASGPPTVAAGPLLAHNGATITPATYLPVDAADGVRTVLIGGAGFDDRNVDFTDRLDDLNGGNRGDLLLGGDGPGPGGAARSVLHGQDGDDVIVSGSGRSRAIGDSGNDLFLAGSGDTIVEGGGDEDVFAFADRTAAATIDLTDVEDGHVLATQGSAEARIRGVEIYLGGDALTTFVGRGGGGAAIFVAGAGGGDFTLKAGDRAFGRDGAVDTYRVSATIPDHLVGASEDDKINYLHRNRIHIGNFGSEDLIYVWKDESWVLFDGNQVGAALAPAEPIEPNVDFYATSVRLQGSSSYGTLYPAAEWEVRGANLASFVYPAGTLVYRDVAYAVSDSTALGTFTFTERRLERDSSSPEYLILQPLSSEDELLTLVIDGFSDGDGGISFSHDGLAAAMAAESAPGFIAESGNYSGWSNLLINPADVTDPLKIPIATTLDLVDGAADGWLYGGGATIASDDPDFNYGLTLLGGGAQDWDSYLLAMQEQAGTGGDDSLDGGDGSDWLSGGGGLDLLSGGGGEDLLDGGEGADVMAGGDGDDTYHVDDAGDVVIEAADEGTDTVFTTLSAYTLPANVEALIYAGAGNFTGAGNALDNLIRGGDGDDSLSGGAGDDGFQASAGADSIDGGDGFDTLRIAGALDSIAIAACGATVSVVDYNQSAGAIALTGVEAVWFSQGGESFTIAELLDPSVTGTNGADSLLGNALGNDIYGLDGDDVLAGAGGNDTLDGGGGHDVAAFAGASTDYRASLDDGGIMVEDLAGGEGADWLVGIEALHFAGDDVTLLPGDLPALGTSGNDALAGSARPDSLFGQEGDDSLDGLGGDDMLDGGEGDDSYALGAGDDSAYDPLGDDLYGYDPGDGDDQVSENAGFDVLAFGAGIDPLDVIVTGDGDDYVLSFAGAAGSVTIRDGALEDHAIEEVRFADTTVWTAADLHDMAFGALLMGFAPAGAGDRFALAGETMHMV